MLFLVVHILSVAVGLVFMGLSLFWLLKFLPSNKSVGMLAEKAVIRLMMMGFILLLIGIFFPLAENILIR